MLSIAQIRENSKQLCVLNERIAETYRHRDCGPEQYARWVTACDEFHRRFDLLGYPGGSAEFAKVKIGDADGMESAIQFLLADPRHFRSGYMKEYLWRTIPRHSLSPASQERLEEAALAYLHRKISREFWYMCRAMARIGSGTLWIRVSQLALNDAPIVAKRAAYLLAFRDGIQAGARIQRQVHREVLRARHG